MAPQQLAPGAARLDRCRSTSRSRGRAAAALGAEGVGKDATILVGNGYVPGHAELTLALVRRHAGLRALFEARYAAQR